MLPKIDVPIYETKLISTGKTIKFRPFLVKEQKLFLISSQSNDINDMVNSVKQVITNCVLDDIDVNNLATFDIEHLFIQMRARSVSEVVNLKYTCNNKIKKDENAEEQPCNNPVGIDLNLLEIHPIKNELHSDKIEITDKVGIVMKYPTFDMMNKLNLENEDFSQILEIIIECIDYIYDENNVYYKKDVTKEELISFIENLEQSNLEKIQKFFDTLPKIKKDIDFKCNKCGYTENIVVEGLASFFV
jgi:hypothetical protein